MKIKGYVQQSFNIIEPDIHKIINVMRKKKRKKEKKDIATLKCRPISLEKQQ